MNAWRGVCTDIRKCVICGRKTGEYAAFQRAGVSLKLYACAGEHIAYAGRKYAIALIAPLLRQAAIIAHGRPEGV